MGSSLDVVKVELAFVALHDEGALGVLLNDPSVDEVADEHGGGLIVVGLLLRLVHLQLHLVETGSLGPRLVLLVQLGLLLFLDLPLSSPPLRTDLKHVNARSVEDYMEIHID